MLVLSYSFVLATFLTVWLKNKMLWTVWLFKVSILIATVVFRVKSALLDDLTLLLNVGLLYMYLSIQSLLYDVEDSREKLDRFFSYNFLFFDDE